MAHEPAPPPASRAAPERASPSSAGRITQPLALPPPAAPAGDEDVIPAPVVAAATSLAALVACVVTVLLISPGTFIATLGSLVGPEPKGYWYLARTTGFVAYGLLWWSMALGLMITNRLARAWPGGPAVNDLHEHASLLGLAFGAAHALALLGDHYIGYTLAEVVIPFAGASYRPLWVGVGQIAFYLMAILTLSFYVRSWIGRRFWRAIHAGSFSVFALALAHGLLSGTDSGAGWARLLYALSAASLAALTAYRLVVYPRWRLGRAA